MSRKPVDAAKALETTRQLWAPSSAPEDGMTLEQLAVQRDALRRAMTRMDAIQPNCQSCQKFELGACKDHGEIPVEFQRLNGQCPDWRYDGIPF